MTNHHHATTAPTKTQVSKKKKPSLRAKWRRQSRVTNTSVFIAQGGTQSCTKWNPTIHITTDQARELYTRVCALPETTRRQLKNPDERNPDTIADVLVGHYHQLFCEGFEKDPMHPKPPMARVQYAIERVLDELDAQDKKLPIHRCGHYPSYAKMLYESIGLNTKPNALKGVARFGRDDLLDVLGMAKNRVEDAIVTEAVVKPL